LARFHFIAGMYQHLGHAPAGFGEHRHGFGLNAASHLNGSFAETVVPRQDHANTRQGDDRERRGGAHGPGRSGTFL
jgi:hypothetical protein